MTASIGIQQNHIGLQIGQDDHHDDKQSHREETSKSEGTQAGGSLGHQKIKTSISTGTGTRSKDYNENIMHEHQITSSKRNKSKSTEDMNHVDSGTLKKMLKPIHGNESPVTSPEMGRRRHNYYNASTNTAPHGHQHIIHNSHLLNNNSISRQSSQSSRFSGSR